MSLLVATDLSKAFGALDVFQGVSARVEAGDRIGLVGPNGTGKTTFLRILAGVESATTGEITRRRGLTVGYLPQDPPLPGEQTLHEAMLGVFAALRSQEAALTSLEHRLAAAAAEAAPDYDELLAAYGQAQMAFEAAGGYDYEVRIAQVLGGLGFNADEHDKPLSHLSGGERTRALLAELILREPDLLLLDEPTNHLDLEAIEWLEETLLRWDGALVIVAHDRYFLDKVATRIWEMAFGELAIYRGNYTAYRLQYEDRLLRQRREWEEQQEYIAKTEDFIRRNLAGQRTKEAQGRRTRLERYLRDEAVDRPLEHKQISLRLTTQVRSGELVLLTKDLVVGYDQPLFSSPDLEVRRLDRVALIGPNGAGKTTFLKTILGQIPPLAGRARLGASVHVGYLAQAQAGLNPDQTVMDAIEEIKDLPTAEARNFLGQFLFSGEDVFRTIGTLSGGQRSRVALARLTLKGANFLLLDEPTNHLDLPSQEILQEVLGRFPGTILLVSHDRYLVEGLATHIWRVGGDELRVYKGNYSEYLRQVAIEREAMAAAKAAAEAGATLKAGPAPQDRERAKEERRQRRAAEQRAEQAAAMEVEIQALEKRLAELSTQLEVASLAGNVGKVQELGTTYQTTDAELQRVMAEWAEMV
ncbi:MAG TPA: ABC-F family ATP-binding cassette domain-containing protein [Anaerolineae bacterium]